MDAKLDSLPNKPRLHQSYQVLKVPETDEIQLQSEGRTLRLKPCDSSQLLEHLIALLDGTHTVDEIVREMNEFDESQVIDSLQQLSRALLLEDAAPAIVPLSTDQQQFYASQLTFFSQFANEPYSFHTRLAQSQVAVVGLGTIGSLLLASLAENGVGELVGIDIMQDSPPGRSSDHHDQLRQQCRSRNPWVSYRTVTMMDDSAKSIVEAAQGSQLLVLAIDTQDRNLFDEVNDACLQTGTVWMPAGIRAWQGYVGPTVLPHQTACYKCYQLRMEANLIHYEPYLLHERDVRMREQRIFGRLPQFSRVITDIAAIEVVKLLTNFSPPSMRGRILTIDFLTLATEFHEVLRLPRCPACGEPSHHNPMVSPWS